MDMTPDQDHLKIESKDVYNHIQGMVFQVTKARVIIRQERFCYEIQMNLPSCEISSPVATTHTYSTSTQTYSTSTQRFIKGELCLDQKEGPLQNSSVRLVKISKEVTSGLLDLIKQITDRSLLKLARGNHSTVFNVLTVA